MSGEMLHARIGHVSALMCLQQLEVRQSILQTAVASAAAKGVLLYPQRATTTAAMTSPRTGLPTLPQTLASP